MGTLNDKFHEFGKRLTLSEGRQQQVSQRIQRIADLLQELRIGQSKKVGSFTRGTALPPVNDADLLLVLHSDFHRPGMLPYEALEKLKSELEARLRQDCRVQPHSVGVRYQDFCIDVVPAYALPGAALFKIPEINLGTRQGVWIDTNPAAHVSFAGQRDQVTGAMAIPIVRMLKCWNRNRQSSLKSIHLELMVLNGFQTKPSRYVEGAVLAFQAVATGLKQGCPDPANPGSLIRSDYLSVKRREDLARAAEKAAATLKQAQDLERNGDIANAVALCYGVFGDPFPP